MLVRLTLWNLGDSDTDIEELRRYLREEAVDAFSEIEGLLFKAWVSDVHTERWGAVHLFASREVADQTILGRAGELIGRPPDVVEDFDLEATVSIAPQLKYLGLALET